MHNKFLPQKALTFDDVLIVPNESQIIPSQVSLKTHLTKNISLSIPVLSAAMDTVTESRMAIKMAQLGGLGIIHKNMSFGEQAQHIYKVKNFEGGIIKAPIYLIEDDTLEDYFTARRQYAFSGFPVVAKGSLQLIGFISEKDVKFVMDRSTPITQIMTKRENLITVKKEILPKESMDIIKKNKIEQLLVVDHQDSIIGLIPSVGFIQANIYNQATRDKQSRLMVGAAVGTGSEEEKRVEYLVEAGVDLIVIDTAHGHSYNVKNMVQFIKKHFSSVDVIAGNIATYDGAKYLIDAGVDGVKVGIGAGSICTTRIVAGVGVPQLTALLNVQKACDGTGIKFIADGGLKNSGDIAKAIASGAHSVMLGSLLAGTDETPGNLITQNGQSYKEYRGMGSIPAMMKGSADRYFQGHAAKQKEKLVPEGVEARILYKGVVENMLYQLLGGVRSSMGYTGSETIADFHERSQFVEITNAGLKESHVHSVQTVGESPNYNSL